MPGSMPYLQYPYTRREDCVEGLHGIAVPDPYRWLEELDSPETREWISDQNRLTEEYLSGISAREKIRKRLTELWNYEKFAAPVKHGGRYFFSYNDGLQDQNVLLWMKSLDEEPRLLLDPNLFSEDGTIALTGFSVSEDGRYLAYGLSASGSDWQEWRVRRVDSGEDLPDLLQWVKFSLTSWRHQEPGFFYSRYDEPEEGLEYKGANYYQKLYYHRLGTSQSADVLIYERPDQPEWGFDGKVTSDGRYLVISVWKGTQEENGVFYKDLESEEGAVVELLADFDASYYFIANDGPVFYFNTNLEAPFSRIIAIDTGNPDRSGWKTVVPQAEHALENATLVNHQFIGTYLEHAHSQIKIFDQSGAFVRQVDLPGLGTATGFEGQPDDIETFYHFTGITAPGSVYRLDLEGGTSTIFREPQLRFDAGDYLTEQVFYPSKDGTQIPMFLSYKKGLNPDGDLPAYLYGYGGFNIPLTPTFSVSNLAWMEMGGIFAQANLRGGGEYGKAWHDAGKKNNKQNVFDDFIAAAEWLIANNYTSPDKLAIAGRSNGGLLVGACMTQRPDLFRACLPNVGVLDMLRFHKFTIGWAWVSDYGSPDDPDEFRCLYAYSPYHNIRAGTRYPATLIATGDHDDRVFPAHSFKFASALQAAVQGSTGDSSAPILIRIDTKAGHGVGKSTTQSIDEFTDFWAFLVENLGIEV